MNLIRTKHDCSFIKLSDTEFKENYTAHRFYYDSFGRMTLMWEYDGRTKIASCSKKEGVWIAEDTMFRMRVGLYDKDTPEYAALEALLEEAKVEKSKFN